MNVPRKPWPTSLVIFIIWLIVVVGGGLLQVKGQPTQLDELVKNQIMFNVLVAMVFLTGVITFLKWWPQVGWKGPDNLQDLRLLWPPAVVLIFLLLTVIYTGLPSTRVLMLVIVNTLMVGISEELMFRGILFHGASSSFGIWRAVWITAIIFGTVHTLNGLITGDFRASTLQAFFAATFGIWTVALRVRLDTIIPVIIIHWLWDCLAFLTSFLGDLALLPFALVLFIYGLWLLRNDRRGKVELPGVSVN
jgi:membrane protease YdiL (CAAX protease family)